VCSGSGLCDDIITRPEESYQLWWSRYVWSSNLVNEEAHWGLLRQKQFIRHNTMSVSLKYETPDNRRIPFHLMLSDTSWNTRHSGTK